MADDFTAILKLINLEMWVRPTPDGRLCLMSRDGIVTPEQAQPIIDALTAFYADPDEWLIEIVNREPEPETARGFVYVLRWDREYKIGFTRQSIGTRQRAIWKQTGRETEVICVIETEDPEGLEAYLHSRFAAARLWQEWFDLSKPDLDYIKGLAA